MRRSINLFPLVRTGIVLTLLIINCVAESSSLRVLTIATNQTDGLERLIYGLKFFNFTYEILGMGSEWVGGSVQTSPGGGQKINIMREYFSSSKDLLPDQIILYIDGYDVIVNSNPNDIISRFTPMKKSIVFGAEKFCWPDKDLENQYTPVQEGESRFLNSGGFIGYAKNIKEMVSQIGKVDNTDDDQLIYTKYFLSNKNKKSIGLDIKSEIFQNLNGDQNHLSLHYDDTELVHLKNDVTETHPVIIHGNGPSKLLLNRISNYVGGSWSLHRGCLHCDTKDLLSTNMNQWPRLVVFMLVNEPTPFGEEFLTKLSSQTYPKHLIHLEILNTETKWGELLNEFVRIQGDLFATLNVLPSNTSSLAGFNKAISQCKLVDCDHLILIDGTAHLDDDESLIMLIGLNRSIVAPILKRENSLFTNFWGSITPDGFYDRSDDYVEIVENKRIGVWNVPFISSCILFRKDKLPQLESFTIQHEKENKPDSDFDLPMKLCSYLRQNDIFMWASNLYPYGHLINNENYRSNVVFPDLYEIFNNPKIWSAKYLHPHFYEYVQQADKIKSQEEWKQRYMRQAEVNASAFYIREPCPDVFWYPLFSERFSKEMIATCEANDNWSLGKHNDSRIPGGYENVPTDDTHMTQINFQEHWMKFLEMFIEPIQKRIFLGYNSNPLRAPLTFVVRYDKSIQDSLRPHHDASTYTLDVALNKYNVDYTGGGVRFVRYNCSLIETPLGWTVMFPGRLTHLHEGLKIGSGRRYIFVTFIDP